MDTTRAIHVASEVVLLGGVIYYFNSQVKGLKSEIKELKAKIEENQQGIGKHLNNLYSAIDKIGKSVTHLNMIGRGMSEAQNSATITQHHNNGSSGLRRRKKVAVKEIQESGDSHEIEVTDTDGREEDLQSQDEFSRENYQSSSNNSNEQEITSLDDELGEELQQLEEQDESEEDTEETPQMESKGMQLKSRVVASSAPSNRQPVLFNKKK